jgi:hypothetical protein
MLLAFILIQLAMNMVILASLIRLLRERKAYSREACRREERLESLARDLCAVGREVTRQSDRVAGLSPNTDPGGPEVRDTDILSEQPPTKTSPADPVPTDPVQGARELLQHGVAVDTIVGETTLLEGELQVLRNLARGSGSSRTARRVARVGMASRRETTGESRRHAGGGRPEQHRAVATAGRTVVGARSAHEARPTEVAR